ncbi:MAG: murein biosynthesis integral membrane protein MurJ [Deltaproteobacteria bacterium]|jgi:putative peptidoglycan lipid II flippase|nr:murein biosynthesis integral membrane protein MurJ [Deltaproteobacteria bacterium]MBW2534137.1 murein biosynthesis integral membrane protein MurJ [Deltaproteobacteria bacterium]
MSDEGRAALDPSSRPSGVFERSALAARASVVAAGTLLSRGLGLVREMAFAALFRRAETDAFYVAFAIPNALRLLLAEGAASSAVVPVLAETRATSGPDGVRRLLAALRGVWLALLLAVAALGIVFAPQLCELFAGGAHAQPGQFERTVLLTRWTFPFLVFMGAAALGSAALHTHRQFAVPAFAPGLMNLGLILFAVVAPLHLSARGLEPALALALGALAGGALCVAAHWPALRRLGYLVRPRLDPSHPGVREILRRLLPMTFGAGVYFVNIAVSRRLLSDLGEGPQSYFTWAFRLCALPQGLFAMALATAALPSLAELAAAGERKEVADTCSLGVRLGLFVGLPVSVALVVLGHPLVVALFQRGQFDERAALETAAALWPQALGIGAVVVVRQLVPALFAQGDTRTPVLASTVNLVCFVGLASWWREPLGHPGVGLALSVATAVQLVVLWTLLARKLPALRLGPIARSAGRTLLACAVAGLAAWLVAEWIGLPRGAGWLRRLGSGLGGAAVFGVGFLTAAKLLRSPELATIGSSLRRRLAQPS